MVTIGPRVTLSQPTTPSGPIVATWTNHAESEDCPIHLEVTVNGVLQGVEEIAAPRDMVGTESFTLDVAGFSHRARIGVRATYEIPDAPTPPEIEVESVYGMEVEF